MRADLITKLLIGSGTLLMLASMLGTYAGIYSSFSALKMNETAGIGGSVVHSRLRLSAA